MKTYAKILTCITAFCIVSCDQVDRPSGALKPKTSLEPESSFEVLKAPVLKVYSAKDSEHQFIAYVVKWKDLDVIVSSPLGRSTFKVGDTIDFMAQKITLKDSNGQTTSASLSFTLLN